MPTLTDPRYTAYRWAADRIASTVKGPKWQTWDGKSPAGPMPLSACGSGSLEPVWEAEEPQAGGDGILVTQAGVRVEIRIKPGGTDLAKTAELWRKVQAAFEPAANTREARRAFQASHRAAGISWIEYGQPAMSPGQDAESVGWVRLVVFLKR